MKAHINKFILLLLFLFLCSCNYSGNVSGLHYLLDMHDSLAVEAQEEDHTNLYTDHSKIQYGMDKVPARSGKYSGMRIPPENTVPMGKIKPYKFELTQIEEAKKMRNPIRKSKENLARGEKEYNSFCTPCHGGLGHGDGTIAPYLGNMPSLVRREIRQWSDGEIYHLITLGRSRMLPYAAQIDSDDRWKIIHYIRVLQKNNARKK